MTIVSRHIFINAPLSEVWAAVADFKMEYPWWTVDTKCHVLTEVTTGVGAKRPLKYDEGNYSVEEIVEWNPPHALVV